MEPIGVSSTWRWHGYDNAWIDLDGRKVQSLMTGGGQLGGGTLQSTPGTWRASGICFYVTASGTTSRSCRRSGSRWLALPCSANNHIRLHQPSLNRSQVVCLSVPESSVTFRGNGQNIIYVDWQNDLVVVVPWIGGGDALDEFLGKWSAYPACDDAAASRIAH